MIISSLSFLCNQSKINKIYTKELLIGLEFKGPANAINPGPAFANSVDPDQLASSEAN